MLLPIVHRNGTSKEALLEQVCIVGRALGDVLRAMADTAPNQRDYYPESGRWEKALTEYAHRVETITVMREVYRAAADCLADMD